MAEKISVQIALEGGAEVQRQLEGIGEAGQKAFEQISQSAEQVGGFKNLQPGEVTAQLEQLGLKGTEAFGKIQQAVKTAVKFETLVTGVQSVETAFVALGRAAGPVGAAIAAGLQAAVKATIAFAEEISKVTTEATKLGLTVTQFDQMRRSMEGLGVSSQTAGQGIKAFSQVLEQSKIDNVNNAFKELQDAATRGFGATGTQQLKTLQDAAQGTGKAAELAAQKLQELGQAVPPNAIAEQFKKISDSIQGLSRVDAAATVIRALQAIQDPAQRAALAIKFFGDQAGAELAQKLQTGAAGAATFQSAVSNLITPQDAAKADALVSAINRLESAWSRFGSVALAPAITPVIDTIAAAVDNLNAKLSQNPWGTLAQGASLLNPVNAVVQTILASLGLIPPAAQQAGQAGAQAGQQGAQGFQSWDTVLQQGSQGFQPWVDGATAAGQAGAQAGQQAAQGFGAAFESAGQLDSLFQSFDWASFGQGADSVGQAAVTSFNQVVSAIQGAGSAVADFASQIAGITWDAISSAGVAAWNAITSAIQTAIDAIARFLGLQSQAGSSSGQGASGKARGGLIGGSGSGTSDSNLAWVSRGEFVMRAAAVRQFGPSFFAALNGGRIPRFQDGGLIDFGAAGTPQGAPKAVGRGGGLSSTISNWIDRLSAANNSAISATDAHLQELSTVIAAIDADKWKLSDALFNVMVEMTKAVNSLRQAGLARGGLIGGRGSGTSDSNLAWLSRGEFVITAAAVRRFGADFFAMLNAGMLPGFALGGLVPRPAMASGGGMNHVTIQFPGLPAIDGLRASSAVVEELQRAAALAQVRSGGRKPSRYS